jgi:capping protein beta
MSENSKLQDCIQLINRLPVSTFDNNITAISNLIYDEDELLNEFLQKLDNRIEICQDDILGEFIKSEYNREGDSYRSPHSNKYFPASESDEDLVVPSKELRDLEVKLNKIFQIYTRNYYSPNAICSVYTWHLDGDSFAVAVLIRNNIQLAKEIDSGVWDSINIINLSFGDEVTYKLTSTVSLQMTFQGVSLSGSVTKQV